MARTALENRLTLATGLWKSEVGGPLPKLSPGSPAEQIEEFELKVVEAVCSEATPDNAREAAQATWELVHDRPETDPVRQLVTEWHEKLARLSKPTFG